MNRPNINIADVDLARVIERTLLNYYVDTILIPELVMLHEHGELDLVTFDPIDESNIDDLFGKIEW